MIEIRDFRKTYGDVEAVRGVTLRIGKGEVYGLIGPNGAGKTTTLRFLATLLRPTRGEASINGYSVLHETIQVRRAIGYLPDVFGVYDRMTVREYLDFFACCYGIPGRQRKVIVGDVLLLLDLEASAPLQVAALSRGQLQRLGLAKTLLHDPPVLLLDEPASGLDPRARLEIVELLRELREMGKTILISSHILPELARCCTSVGIMQRGRLVASGEIEALKDRYRDGVTYRIQADGDLEAMLALVRAERGVTRAWSDRPGEAAVAFEGDGGRAAAVLARVVGAGYAVTHFAKRDISLEDVFLAATGGDAE